MVLFEHVKTINLVKGPMKFVWFWDLVSRVKQDLNPSPISGIGFTII